MTHPAALKYAADFAARRRADDGTMNRLYVLESNVTVTGSNADHRFAVRSGDIRGAAALLGQNLAQLPLLKRVPSIVTDAGGRPFLELPFVADIAADLERHQGRGVIIAGPQQPAGVHALAHLLNAALGNVGQTVTFTDEPDTSPGTLAELCTQMHAGKVETLLLLGGHPVYSAPADIRFQEALAKVKTSIHLSHYER